MGVGVGGRRGSGGGKGCVRVWKEMGERGVFPFMEGVMCVCERGVCERGVCGRGVCGRGVCVCGRGVCVCGRICACVERGVCGKGCV